MPKQRKMTFELAQQARYLLALGVSQRRVAKQLNIAVHSVKDLVYKHTFVRPHSERAWRKPENPTERFWQKVKICLHGKSCHMCCFEWLAAKVPSGYGVFWYNMNGKKTQRAHQFAITLKIGRHVAEDKIVCHTCHNYSCVNPKHLYEGTWKTNYCDMVQSGRIRYRGKKKLQP